MSQAIPHTHTLRYVALDLHGRRTRLGLWTPRPCVWLCCSLLLNVLHTNAQITVAMKRARDTSGDCEPAEEVPAWAAGLSSSDRATLTLLSKIPEMTGSTRDRRGRRKAVCVGGVGSARFVDALSDVLKSGAISTTDEPGERAPKSVPEARGADIDIASPEDTGVSIELKVAPVQANAGECAVDTPVAGSTTGSDAPRNQLPTS
jgi:hypothetical protein